MHSTLTRLTRFIALILGRTDTQRLPRPKLVFACLFFYFLASQLMTSSTFIYHVGFYGLLLPSFLYALAKDRALLAQIPYNVGTLGLVMFHLFVAAQSVIGGYADPSLAKSLFEVLLSLLFVLMALAIFADRRIDSLTLLRSFMLTVTLFAPLSILWDALDPTSDRLLPIGRAHNPIPIDNLYAIGALIGVWMFFQAGTSRRWKLLAVLCLMLCILVTLLTTQRGPLLALAAAGLAALMLLRQWRPVLLAAGAVAILGTDFYYYHTHGGSLLHLERVHAAITHFLFARDSSRLAIWQQAFAYIAAAPWQGHGLQATFVIDGLPEAVNPHNGFISALYYHGVAGFALFLIPLIAAFVYAFRGRSAPYHQLCLILLVHAVVAISTNYGQMVKAPSPLWTIYWLPVAMALARPVSRQKLSVGQA